MKSSVLILGASASYLGCIRSAKEMGLEVHVTDQNPHAVGLSIADHAHTVDITDDVACLKIVQDHQIQAVIAVNDFGVLTAAKISEKMNLPGIPVLIAEIGVNKLKQRELWQKSKIESVRFQHINSFTDFKSQASEFGFPFILKPCDSRGGGSRGVCFVDSKTDLGQAYDFANSFYRDDDLMIEELIQGSEHSAEVIVFQKKSHVIGISDRQKAHWPACVDEMISYPASLTEGQTETIKSFMQKVVDALGLTEGVMHVEFAMTPNGPVLFELGLRCGGGSPDPLMPYFCGVHEFQEALRLALGQRPKNLKPLFTKAAVLRFIYASPGRIESISGFDEARALHGVLDLSFFAKEGDIVNEVRTSRDRLGMMIVGAETRLQAEEISEKVLQTVKIKIH